MAAAPTNLLLAQNFGDLSSLGRANSPAITGTAPGGGPPPNGLQFQTREEAQMFLQAAGRAQQNGGNPGGIALTRDAVAALQHAAQVAAMNQAKNYPPGGGGPANGNLRHSVPVAPPMGQSQSSALANLHTHAQLQAAMNAQRAAQAAAAQQNGNLSANNQAALFLMQNQLAQAQQAANSANNPFNLQNGLQNNPIAAAAAAAAAVAATTQAAQARAAAVGNANLLQLQQAAQAAGLQRPQAMAWAQNQALQNAALAQQNLAAAQSNPALLAAALQAQQARAALQVQQLAQQHAAAAAARPLAPSSQPSVAAAQQLQVLRQLQARLNAAHAPNGLSAAAAPPTSAPKPTEAQLQALRSALARSAAGRAALNAANVLGANAPRSAMPPAANGTGQAPALNPLQQAINLQLLLQQQRNAVQVQQAQAQVNAMANNLANMQNNAAAAAALNSQLAALQQAAAANAAANGQRQLLQNAGNLSSMGGPNAGAINDVLLQNLQKMQLAKAMQDSAAAANAQGMNQPPADKAPTADAAASNSSKEQRRLALACVALQLARGGMTVEQAINSGIMGGMSVTDVKFIVECYNAERQRMQSEGTPAGAAGAGAPAGPTSVGGAMAGAPQQGPGMHQQMMQHGAPSANGSSAGSGGSHMGGLHMPGMGLGMAHGAMPGQPGPHGMHAPPPGIPGMPGMHPPQHGMHGMPGMGMAPQLPFAPSPTAPGSPALVNGDAKEAGNRSASASAPISPPRTASQGSPVQRGPLGGPASDAEGALQETRSESGTSEQLAADAAATMAVLAKEPFDAFSYAFFGPTDVPTGGGLEGLIGELENGGQGGALEGGLGGAVQGAGGALEGALEGDRSTATPLGGLGELDPDQAAWLRAAASANQAMWAGETAEEGPMSNDEIAARLANLDLGSGFF